MRRPHHPKAANRPRKRRIFLVDDHPVTRQGLARLLDLEPDLEVCGQAGTPARAVIEIDVTRPDLAVIDISLGGKSGLELIKDLAKRHPRLLMLVLSTHDEALYAERALRAGAKGYVMKQEPVEHLIEAIRRVLNGELHLSEPVRAKLVHKQLRGVTPAAGSSVEALSDRELDVFRLLGQGRSTRQVATQLHLSISTVETHRAHIKEKLHLQSAPELVQRAVQWLHAQHH